LENQEKRGTILKPSKKFVVLPEISWVFPYFVLEIGRESRGIS